MTSSARKQENRVRRCCIVPVLLPASCPSVEAKLRCVGGEETLGDVGSADASKHIRILWHFNSIASYT